MVPQYRNRHAEFMDAHVQFFANSLNYTRKETYVDGTKSIRRAYLLANDNRLDVKLLHLVRDGRAFCCSFIKARKLPISSVSLAAKEWQKYIKDVDKFSNRFPGIPVKTVRYEDLCRNSDTFLMEINH